MTDPIDTLYAAKVGAPDPPSLETVLCDPAWFGLTTASPLQRAICRWATGQASDVAALGPGYDEEIAKRCSVGWYLNGGIAGAVVAVLVYLLAGIRCGKSLLAAAVAVWASQTVDVSSLRPGERARFSIVSLDKDKAKAVLMHLNSVLQRPAVAPLVVGDVRADGLDLRHPSGTIIEIRVIAGRRAGGGLVAYWSAGVVFDEAPRMVGDEEGVVNFDDSRKAVLGRLLPGAQLWAIGSLWAPMGPVYDAVTEYWGNAGRVLVVRAPAPAMNPYYWTPTKCEEMRGTDPEAYRMDELGEWGTPETAMFGDSELTKVLRPGELPPVDGETYYAAIDPSGRGGNAWTLVIGGIRRDTMRKTLYAARQWYPSEDFTEGDVLDAMKPLLEQYRVQYCYTDQFASGFIKSLALAQGLAMVKFEDRPWTAANKLDAFDGLRVMVRMREVELIDAPSVREDLLRVRRKLTQSGATITFPGTADGRHCDYAPAIAMWAGLSMNDPEGVVEVDPILVDEQRMMDDEDREEPTRRRAPFRGRRSR